MPTDPDQEEMEAIFAADPGLRAHLDDLVDQYLRGDLKVVDDEELGRILDHAVGQRLAS